jgi:hypothetical protein
MFLKMPLNMRAQPYGGAVKDQDVLIVMLR